MWRPECFWLWQDLPSSGTHLLLLRQKMWSPDALLLELSCCLNWEVTYYMYTWFQLDSSKEYQYLPPTQPPIRPPYQQACHLRKNNLLAKEDAPSVVLNDALSAVTLDTNQETDTWGGHWRAQTSQCIFASFWNTGLFYSFLNFSLKYGSFIEMLLVI